MNLANDDIFIVLTRQQISPREIVCGVLAVCLFGITQRCAWVFDTLELRGASQPELTTTAFALL